MTDKKIIELASRSQGVTESELRRMFGQKGVEKASELASGGKLHSTYGAGARPVMTFRVKTEPKVFNHTNLSWEQIKALPLLGAYTNNWRQRTISLYRVSEGSVISVGISFDNSMAVISQETDQDHWRALEAFREGRSYTAQ